jgi:hypothetical protein
VPELRNCDVVFLPLFPQHLGKFWHQEQKQERCHVVSLLHANRTGCGLFFFSYFDFDFGIFMQRSITPIMCLETQHALPTWHRHAALASNHCLNKRAERKR